MLTISLFVLAVIFILNVVLGMYFKFGYRHYWFFEILHFLGGFFVVMFFSSFFQSTALILVCLGFVVFLWELVEYLVVKIPRFAMFFKKTFKQKNVTYGGWKDTALDIVLDFAGAGLFLYLIK